MIIRVQSPDGMSRVNLDNSAAFSDLYAKTKENITSNRSYTLYKDRERKRPVKSSRSRVDLKHGDILYLFFDSGLNIASTTSDTEMNGSSSKNMGDSQTALKNEDEIDKILWKEEWDHGIKAGMNKVDALRPDPWDQSFLKEKGIKFMSFHSHMRQLISGVDKGKFAGSKFEKMLTAKKLDGSNNKRLLSEMPSSITLNRQPYRHVDNVCFQNREIMDRFLERWRTTGHQQAAWLFGSYSKLDDVPLGIRCNVDAIYPMPQEFKSSRLTLSDDEHEKAILEIADRLGLQRVGWIVTDLDPDKDGLVKNIRNGETHFVSAEECIIAGRLQAAHPNPCRLAPSGEFGSKFVTIIVTGKDDGQIDFRGYQVSNQGQSLATDGTIVPTLDAPEFGYTRETSDSLFCPDIFYRQKDEYGNDVTKIGRPLPIEYLLTDMGCNFAMEFSYKAACKSRGFKPESVRDLSAIGAFLKNFKQEEYYGAFRDFNFLVALATNDTLPIKPRLNLLLDALKTDDQTKFLQFINSTEWLTTDQILLSSIDQPQAPDVDMEGVDDELRMAIERSLRET